MEDSKRLSAEFLCLVSEIERQLGHKLCWESLTSRWGLYSCKNRKGNFGNVMLRAGRSTKLFPHCKVPHLVVATDKEWAEKAVVPYDDYRLKFWQGNRKDAAYWCISEGDYDKVIVVAGYLAKIYRVSPAQEQWLEQNR